MDDGNRTHYTKITKKIHWQKGKKPYFLFKIYERFDERENTESEMVNFDKKEDFRKGQLCCFDNP